MTMKRLAHVTSALLPLGLATQAFGQGTYYYPETPAVQVQFETGGAIPTGDSEHLLDSGFTIGGGVLFHPAPGPFALRTTFDYTRLDASREAINDAAAATETDINGGKTEVYALRVNALLETATSPYTRAYITAGMGGAYVHSDFTERFGGPGFFGEPFVVARDDERRFTWNAGVGLNFSNGGWQSVFVESTYEHVSTRQETTFVPIRIGVRF